MATLRIKRKLAAVTRETQEEHPRNGQSRNTSVPRINEEFTTQVSEEIEGRVIKKLSQEYSRTESRILGALSKLDEFLLNQQIQTHSGTVSGTFRNRSGNIPEHKRRKPGNEWGRLPEWSSSWSRHLPRPDYTKFWPNWLSWQKLWLKNSSNEMPFESVKCKIKFHLGVELYPWLEKHEQHVIIILHISWQGWRNCWNIAMIMAWWVWFTKSMLWNCAICMVDQGWSWTQVK